MIYKRLYILNAGWMMAVSWMLGALLATACPAQDAVLQAAASAVQAQYLDEAEAARIADALRSWSAQQRYADSCSDPAAFSARLNQDLDMFDGHFHVERVDAAAGQDDWLMAWRADARSNGAGVREVRVLEGNIGYLRLSTFYPLDLARPKFAAAFTLLADTDGLVLDLRQNGEATMQVPTCWCARCWTRRSARCSSWTSVAGARRYRCRLPACLCT